MYNTPSKPRTRDAWRWPPAVMAAIVLLAVYANAAEQKPEGTSDENAIRAAVESYVAAYNRGDAKAVAAHWSDSGEWISPSGQRFQGKQAIERELQTLFTENKGVHVEVLHPAIRIVSSDAAVEEGTVRVLRPGEPSSDSTYLAIHVKKDGRWKLDTVRETDVPEAAHTDSLLPDLAWLVGKWIDESPDATDEVAISWTKNKIFLNYSFKVSMPEMDDLEGTQVIGWDPAAGRIRSWMFDSDGGFGEGIWSKKGNSWVVTFSQVLPDGRKASATNIYTPVDRNTFTWKSIDRKLDEESLPNVEEVKLTRKKASGAADEAGEAAEKPRAREAKK